jgi:BolA protein
VKDEIDARLRATLDPVALEIEDESAMHAGHAGAASGAHFRLRIVSARFANLTRIARHRLVYDALAEMMRGRIHALAIVALTPEETVSNPRAH